MSDNMQPIDETLDDESLDAVDAEATEAYEDVEEFDPFEGMSDEELDALCDEDDSLAGFGDVEPGFRSGFVALVGRPNAGKSTLLNACYGKKVAITSPVAQTTRRRMRAVVNRPGYQLVFVDTPGIHKPKDGLGSELNKSALFELNDVDVVAFLIDATKPIGRGDAWVAERVKNARSKKVLVLTKADEADPAQVMEQLKAAHELMEYDDEIVTSSVKNFNVDAFIETVAHFLPEGPRWFPEDRCFRRDACCRVCAREGLAPHPRRDPALRWRDLRCARADQEGAARARHHLRRARGPKGHHHRQGRRDDQAYRHRRPSRP
mgnify:CR=1 FL=1